MLSKLAVLSWQLLLDIFHFRKDPTGLKNLSGLTTNDLQILKHRQTNFVQ
jgi:hypothetical protein